MRAAMTPRTDPERFLTTVQQRGHYADPGDAALAITTVLEVLGSHLTDDDRADLARLLPRASGPMLAGTTPGGEARTPEGFVRAVADRDHSALTVARRDTTAVLGALTTAADRELLRRILDQLPPDHATLFGIPEKA